MTLGRQEPVGEAIENKSFKNHRWGRCYLSEGCASYKDQVSSFEKDIVGFVSLAYGVCCLVLPVDVGNKSWCIPVDLN